VLAFMGFSKDGLAVGPHRASLCLRQSGVGV